LTTTECKNIEVIKIGNSTQRKSYISYLRDENLFTGDQISSICQEYGLPDKSIEEQTPRDVSEVFKQLPQAYRASGIAKYRYSASRVACPTVGDVGDHQFVEQFRDAPLTIDFQRTRNSTAEDGDTRKNRFYRSDEIDIVGACLFSRTMEWKFLFAKAENFNRHAEYADRYSNRLTLDPGIWVSDLPELLQEQE